MGRSVGTGRGLIGSSTVFAGLRGEDVGGRERTASACSIAALSKPVATTTSSMAPPNCGFTLVPQMMLASWTAPSGGLHAGVRPGCISRMRTTSSSSASASASEVGDVQQDVLRARI